MNYKIKDMTNTCRKLNSFVLNFGLLLTVALCFTTCTTKETKIWLDDLDLTKAEQAAGGAVRNKSMWNTPLIIAQDTFEHGVGTHALGIMRLELDGKVSRFHAKVGIDQSAPDHELKKASVEFVVLADNKEIWRSGVMYAKDSARTIDLDISGVKDLRLYSDHAGDGIIGDRVNWVDAYFICNRLAPNMYEREQEAKYILTPAESKAPSINAPYIHGASKGNPVLFTLPISGEQPIKIETSTLPDGLSLDEQKGRIYGIAKSNGRYPVNITAKNQYGKAEKTIEIVIGEGICLTPPMGWNSWNVYGKDIDQDKILEAANAMVSSGLINYGYTYINIDDGWQGERGGKYNAILPNDRFPNMKALVDSIHSLGLKAGIYSSPWVWTYAGFTGGSADKPDGTIIKKEKRHGDYSFTPQDVKQWVEWGFDYLKYDWNPNDIEHTVEMEQALRKPGRDIVYSISNGAPFELASEWAKHTNLWRTTFDIHDSWYSMVAIGFSQNPWQPYAGPGHWNDPDMLIVGHLGWGNIHETRLSPNEQYTHISLWSILAAPMLIGCDMTKLDDFTLGLLKNKEIIEVSQDIAGVQGKRIANDKNKHYEIWARPLYDGSLAVGLFNLSENEQSISVRWSDLGISGEMLIRDIWKQQDIGTYKEFFKAKVPVHGVVFVKISKK